MKSGVLELQQGLLFIVHHLTAVERCESKNAVQLVVGVKLWNRRENCMEVRRINKVYDYKYFQCGITLVSLGLSSENLFKRT